MQQLSLKIVPLAQLAIAITLMWLLSQHFPILPFYLNENGFFCVSLIVTGVLIMLAGVMAFYYQETTVDPRDPSKASSLVVAGIYRYSRNPMYLGMAIVLVGVAFMLANLGSLLVVPIFVMSITTLQIVPEELALEEQFGDSYREYKDKVNRWL